MTQIVHLNGALLPIDDAHVSVLDRGFIFGDGVYEVIPVYSRRPFRLHEHLRRLQHSLDGIRLQNPHTMAEWEALIHELIGHNDMQDQSVYLQVTRGPAPRDQAFPKTVRPTVFMMCMELPAPPASVVEHGIRAVSARDFRWERCDLKVVSLLPNVLLRQHSADAGCEETIMFRDGILTEGSASNIFAVENGVILTPPKDSHVLPGITYDVVLELAEAEGIPVDFGHFEESRIREADELWCTSSTKEILAIVELDGRPIANGKPGPIYRRMYQLYQAYKNGVMRHG
ncbi:MAG TPA: D-amino acid aminotransferase [Methylophilaceae bacterium]|jgi:D-alanine transaminase